jgi:hypothetical protein
MTYVPQGSSKKKSMNKLILIFSILFTAGSSLAQDTGLFQSGVETVEKPWTNLNFYNDPDNFQFAIVTDRNGGHRPGIFEDAVEKINMLYPEFVLSVGDLINGYTRDTAQIRYEWEEVNRIIDDLKMPFFYLPGNHDITNRVMAEEWENRHGRRYYHFIYKNTLFIILDSNDDDDHSLTREQTDFVLETINNHPDVRWTFLLMHHPIWTYDTDGKFEELETALSGRDYTVLAGHTHNYLHEKRKGRNYYIMATTGGGSRLRGNYFGEFDHITWVTMTDAGPSLANLRLDGILPHDITNRETKLLASALASNAMFNHVLLCNQGEKFTDGTLYLCFGNAGNKPMTIDMRFYHQHQLVIPEPARSLTIAPGAEQIIEIPFTSLAPVAYHEAEALQIDWQMGYDIPEHPDFQLSGRFDIELGPTGTSFLSPAIPKFIKELTISALHPYRDLKTVFTFDQRVVPDADNIQGNKLVIRKSGEVGIKLVNSNGQSSSPETRYFEKITMLHRPVKVRSPRAGLTYRYYEGSWENWPDFDLLEVKSDCMALDFWVSDYALREDHFAMVFTGYLEVEEDGLYIFQSRSDDACRLILQGETVVDQGSVSENGKDVGAIALKKGFHPVTIQFLESSGRERLRLYVKRTYDTVWEQLEVKGRFYHSSID